MKTPHINIEEGKEIAEVVIMPGDPIRAKIFAKAYLKDYYEINGVRGNIGYTGFYKGKKVSVMASGMGLGSIAIYCYELYNFFNVKLIIRMGTCGAYVPNLSIGDLVVGKKAFTNSNFYNAFHGNELGTKPKYQLATSKKMLDLAQDVSKIHSFNIKFANVNSTDVFYCQRPKIWEELSKKDINCEVVEMEMFALTTIAQHLNKDSLSILAISDNLITNEFSDAAKREKGLGRLFEYVILVAEKYLSN